MHPASPFVCLLYALAFSLMREDACFISCLFLDNKPDCTPFCNKLWTLITHLDGKFDLKLMISHMSGKILMLYGEACITCCMQKRLYLDYVVSSACPLKGCRLDRVSQGPSQRYKVSHWWHYICDAIMRILVFSFVLCPIQALSA